MESQLDAVFQQVIDSGRVPGAAAVALDRTGKTLLSKGWGRNTAGDNASPQTTPQTPCLIWSFTKLATSVAALQLIEQGKLDLYAPAETYVPEIANIPLLHGFHEDGSPDLRAATKKILVLHLFTHTSGCAYDFFDAPTLRYRQEKKQPVCAYVARSAMEDFSTPLAFEPGSRYEYGVSVDWLGWVVERVSGLRLDEYIDAHIAKPLNVKIMRSMSEEEDKNFLVVHTKDSDRNLAPQPTFKANPEPEVIAGGSYLYSTCEDWAQFLLALLNEGTHPLSGVTILKSQTVKDYLFTDWIPKVGCSNEGIGAISTITPALTCPGEMLPGVEKGWSCGLMVNTESVPNGRSKNSGAWAGFGNCYYWIDPTAGKLGVVVSAILPFFDKDVLHLFDAVERAVYEKPPAKQPGEPGSNFSGGSYKTD